MQSAKFRKVQNYAMCKIKQGAELCKVPNLVKIQNYSSCKIMHSEEYTKCKIMQSVKVC